MTNISDREELRQLIARYVRGKASREEVMFLRKYYEHFDDQEDGFERLNSNERAKLKSQIFQEIRYKIKSNQNSQTRRIWIYRTTAAILAMVIVAGALWYSNREGEKMELANVPVQINPFVIDTAFTHDKHIYLPDGSYVVLKPESQLQYPQVFDDENREVVLNGEAYFDIQHENLRPFSVIANGVTTRVLGTAFTISSFEKGAEFAISVTRGRVEVSDQTHQLGVLQKNDQLILDKVTQEVTTKKLKEEERAELEPKEFIMDDMTVADAIDVVEKRWRCTFVIKDPALKNCRLTTSFVPTDDLEEVVAVIAIVTGAEYSIQKNIVSLSGKGCEN